MMTRTVIALLVVVAIIISGSSNAATTSAIAPPPSVTRPLRVLACSSWSFDTTSDGWKITKSSSSSSRSTANSSSEYSLEDGDDGDGYGGVVSIISHGALCLDAEGTSSVVGTTAGNQNRHHNHLLRKRAAISPVAAPCDANKPSQQWRVDTQNKLIFIHAESPWMPGAQCLTVAGTSYTAGPGVLLAPCTGPMAPGVSKPIPRHANEWVISTNTTGSDGGLAIQSNVGGCCGNIWWHDPVCLAVDTEPTCSELLASPGGRDDAKWCDMTQPADERARALVANMTLSEKARNMDSFNFGVPRLAVPPNIFSEALHGICSGCGTPVEFENGYTSTGCPTAFPQVISMGASWNRTLWDMVGRAVSDETRGLYAQGSGIVGGWESALFVWAPNINPFRDPRWGRGQEVVSEEPLVCAEYAAHYIPALQGIISRAHEPGGGKQLPFLKTVATAKHFFDYDLEGVQPETRQEISVNVTARDQVEYFSPPFESAVKRGKTQSVMCSYNAVNGMPACLSDDMINEKMRKSWGFDGFVVSDCDAINDVATHNYIVKKFNGSLQVQAQQAIRGGTDLNCGSLYGEQIEGTVRNGLLKEAEIDRALERVYTKAFQLGVIDEAATAAAAAAAALPAARAQSQHSSTVMSDSAKFTTDNRSSSSDSKSAAPAPAPAPAPATAAASASATVGVNPYAHLGPEVVDTLAHRQLALEGALQGHVLLKNADGSHLPLRGEDIGSLALIGPHANGSSIFLGGPNYHGNNLIVLENTPLLRARAKLPHANVTFAQGCDVFCRERSGFEAAVALAAGVDQVVLYLGLNSSIENEGHDRSSLTLPGQQTALALAVAAAARRPVTIVLVNGGPLAVSELKASPQVGAILEAFMPGQAAAEATFQLLLGEASPSGLLPITNYDADFVQRRPITNLNLRDAGGITHRYFTGTPLWPFGFGMSYGNFIFASAAHPAPVPVITTTVAHAETTPLCFEVKVTNSNTSTSTSTSTSTTSTTSTNNNNNIMASDVVVLGFVSSDLPDSPPNPKLCDFQREANVGVGETRTVKLCIDALGRALALVDAHGNQRVVPGEYTVTVGVKAEGSVGGEGAGAVVGKVVVKP